MTRYLILKIWPFHGPVYWGGDLGASRPMLLCLTLCPLIKPWKSWQWKGKRTLYIHNKSSSIISKEATSNFYVFTIARVFKNSLFKRLEKIKMIDLAFWIIFRLINQSRIKLKFFLFTPSTNPLFHKKTV